MLKVTFSQKGLMPSSFVQTDKPNYFPEQEFWILFPSKWLKPCQKRILSCSNSFFDHSEELHVLFWHDFSHLEGKIIQNFGSGQWLSLPIWRNEKRISPFWEKATFIRPAQIKAIFHSYKPSLTARILRCFIFYGYIGNV